MLAGDENKENEDAQREYEREYDMQALFRHAHIKTQGYYSVSLLEIREEYFEMTPLQKCSPISRLGTQVTLYSPEINIGGGPH